MTPSGSGFRGSFDGAPVTFTVDLAGDAPLPVAGTVLDPLAGRTSQESVPRRFTFLLSGDGVTWQEVLQGELTPLGTDQPFVLPDAVDARFAQLRIDSVWGGPGNDLTLGEWKVVATPGATPDTMPTNIAEPVRGGHVVWMVPQTSSQGDADAMLIDEPGERLVMYSDAGQRLSWVVGFQDDREALLERLEWQDPDGSDPAIRIRRVEVEASTSSPIGPWTPLGTWRIERGEDGSVAPFVLPDGTWARFLRFTSGPTRKGTYQLERPAAIRVIEHPTDDTYRSILGEWGYASPMGPHDLLEPPDLTPALEADLDDDDAGRPLGRWSRARPPATGCTAARTRTGTPSPSPRDRRRSRSRSAATPAVGRRAHPVRRHRRHGAHDLRAWPRAGHGRVPRERRRPARPTTCGSSSRPSRPCSPSTPAAAWATTSRS